MKVNQPMSAKPYQPKTGVRCHCKPGQQRDNCRNCEGTGRVVDFKAIRARTTQPAAQHTPGTWNYSQGEIYVKDGGKYRTIAVAIESLDENERRANARLIAAAPDLLAMLAAIVAEADKSGGRERVVSRYEIDRARAAITKATT